MDVGFSEQLIRRLASADEVVAFTGAGMSAESGVPTFRGNEGIWTKFKPEELANINAFMRNPALVWAWYTQRKQIIGSVRPNAGHAALVQLEQYVRRVTIVTQNIDNLHRRAGSTTVYELHGNIERNYCTKCGTPYNDAEVSTQDGIPLCTRTLSRGGLSRACGGLIRPDVVWFGELLPEEQWNGALRAIERADLFFSVGTSGVVYPAASLPALAKEAGAYLVEVNPEHTPLTPMADEFLMGPAGTVVPQLVQRLRQYRAEQSAANPPAKHS